MQSLMHAFVMDGQGDIGQAARRGLLEIYTFLREEAKFDADGASLFLAQSLLRSILVSLHMGDEPATNRAARELVNTSLATTPADASLRE